MGEWVVGRASDCDITIDDFGLSRQHAKLVVDEHAVRIVDLKSKGGIRVNGVAVVEGPLTNGDAVVKASEPRQAI